MIRHLVSPSSMASLGHPTTHAPHNMHSSFTKKGMAIVPTIMVYGDFLIHRRLLDLLENHGEEHLTPEAMTHVSSLIQKLLALEDTTCKMGRMVLLV